MPENKNIKMTPQRRVILEELKKVKSHPTADEICEMVRKKIPRISLSTVYRNLETMSESGMIRKLDTGGSRMRFDATVENHYHIRCLSCGKVEDVEIRPVTFLEDDLCKVSNYRITGHRLEFVGLCPRCKKRKKQNIRKSK